MPKRFSVANPYTTVSSAYVADRPAAVVPVIGGIIRPTVVVEVRRTESVGDEGCTVVASSEVPTLPIAAALPIATARSGDIASHGRAAGRFPAHPNSAAPGGRCTHPSSRRSAPP
jgi:hypothetical protein